MKSSPSSSKPAHLRDSLHQHLHMYALAASAAGVSLLALAQPSEADIIYTPANVTIGPNQRYNLDLTGDGTIDFTIKNHAVGTATFWGLGQFSGSLFVQRPAGNAVAGHRVYSGFKAFPWAYALNSGMRVSKEDRHFAGARATMAWTVFESWRTSASARRGGSWISGGEGYGVSNRYLGLKFKINGQVHYGWARLSMYSWGTWTATLTGYAYETIPNKPIKAGQEQEGEDSVGQADPAALTQPDQTPATLGRLARGAQAVRLWRRRQEGQSLVKDQSLANEGK